MEEILALLKRLATALGLPGEEPPAPADDVAGDPDAAVYHRDECLFNYCPNRDTCIANDACTNPASWGPAAKTPAPPP